MIKEIVEFMDANEGIENYFLKETFKELYLVNSKNENFLAIVDNKSKSNKLLKITQNNTFDLKQKELQKLIFLENNSKALPRKQLNKDKGVGGAGVFLFSAYYEKIGDYVFLYRTQKKDKDKISLTKGIEYQLESAISYCQNNHLKKILELIKKNIIALIAKHYKDLQFAISEEMIPEKGNIKIACFVSNRAIEMFKNFYLPRKVFSYDVEKNPKKFTSGACHICNSYSDTLSSPAFLSNYGVEFSHKTALGIDFNQIVCPICATKLEKFRYMTENKLTNPFPLFLDKKNLFSQQTSILNNDEKKKSYREMIKSIYYTNPKDLKNYYLINYRAFLSSGSWKLEIRDIDYIETFQYETGITLSNILDMKNSFILGDFYNKVLSVFQFEKIINELIFDKKMQNNYFGDYQDIKITYWRINSSNINHLLANYLVKYRRNFYDFIYKSHHTRLKEIAFREMMLDIIKDNIKHDDSNKNGYSIYENEIKEKLNLLFSLKPYFEGGEVDTQEFLELKKKMHSTLGQWNDQKDESGNILYKEDGKTPQKEFIGTDYIIQNEENDQFFAFLCGQVARFLINKKKGKDENKSHSDFSAFTDWQTSQLLKQYIYEIHRKYAHELKFDKRYDNAMSIINSYRGDLEMDSVMEYMILGYFADNQIKYSNIKEENENE